MAHEDIQQWLRAAQEPALTAAAGRQLRAWHRLQPVLWGEVSERPASASGRGQLASWLLTLGALATVAVAVGLSLLLPAPGAGSSYARSQQPDIYASTFYSSQAEADVVWISGLQTADETSNTP